MAKFSVVEILQELPLWLRCLFRAFTVSVFSAPVIPHMLMSGYVKTFESQKNWLEEEVFVTGFAGTSESFSASFYTLKCRVSV